MLTKKPNTLFFYSNIYLHYVRPCWENIFKFLCIVSQKSWKKISQVDILFFATTRSYLQFQWNWKYLFTVVLRFCGMVSVHFIREVKYNWFFHKGILLDWILLEGIFFYICCDLSAVPNILLRQQFFD